MSDLDDLDLRLYDEPYEADPCPFCSEIMYGLHGTQEPRCVREGCPGRNLKSQTRNPPYSKKP